MIRIINREMVSNLNIPLDDIAKSIANAFVAAANGAIVWQPKIMLSAEGSAFQMSTFANWASNNLMLFHMLLGGTTEAIASGAPQYTSWQLVADCQTGAPSALVDGTYTSNILPAGITRLITPHLARPRSGVATFIGAGTQARLNLQALESVLPISEVRIVTRTRKSADLFSEFVRARGQTPVIMEAGPDAVTDADIVISTIPASPGLKPMFDPVWVSPGTFVNVIDLGRSWKEGFSAYDRLIIDDEAQAKQQYKNGRLGLRGPFDSEIADLLTGVKPCRVNERERIALVHPGNVVGVLGVTKAILDQLKLQQSPL